MKHLKSLFIIFLGFVLHLNAQDKPNILVIWGDDIGWSNVSKYSHGMMGYQTPNIDQLANEGAMFTDWYAQQSCTPDVPLLF
jgi:arylsulfatase A-like enzyme